MKTHGTVTRTCIACRTRRPVQELVGLRTDAGQVAALRIAGHTPARDATGPGVRRGKGSYCCPDRKCAERAVSALLRLGRRHGTKDAEHPAVQLLRQTAEEAAGREQLRTAGLRRRGLDAGTDVLVQALKIVAGRCQAAAEADQSKRPGDGQRAQSVREQDRNHGIHARSRLGQGTRAPQ